MIYIELTILILLIVFIIILLFKKNKNNEEEILLKIDKKLLEFEKSFSENINNNKQEWERTKDIITQNTLKTIETINQLTGTITKLTEEQKYATKLTEDLKYLFQKPKTRGNFTEIILEEMLDVILPKGIWEKQYQIDKTSQEKVDFVIKYRKNIIPIDVKFPIDEYNRYLHSEDDDEKTKYWKSFLKRIESNIKDISNKYILPDKGTSEFAIMFIPSDGVYYDIITQENGNNIFDFAQKYKIMLSGPSNFYAFLQIIITGLKNIEIYENTKKIIENIHSIQKDYEYFNSKYQEVGKYINNAIASYNTSQKHYDKIKKKSDKIIDIDNN